MGKYDKITKYIPLLQQDELGEWIVDTKSAGTKEDPVQMPFVDYSQLVNQFARDVLSYCDDFSKIDYKNYRKLLEERDIEIHNISTSEVDISQSDDVGIVALLMAVVRGERFCEGLLLGALQDGSITKWLLRLKELDR